MARLTGIARRARGRLANCSLGTAFALYAAAALISAVVLSALLTGLLGMLAESTLPDDPYSHSGTYVLDRGSGSLVPAETLSWYEGPAYEALASGEESAEDGSRDDIFLLYVESSRLGDSEPIVLDDPPAGFEDGTILDASWTSSVSDVYEDAMSLSQIPDYDEEAAASRPGSEVAAALEEALPENADGESPVVSSVGYYVPYGGDTATYRAIAGIAIGSVPAVFVACLVVAGRLFYRDRIAGPVADMDAAALRIAEGDLDFAMPRRRDDELGRLCARFEDMRSELARSKAEMWRAAENRRRVNAAFAHDLRTPLTVIRGRADFIGMATRDGKARKAAETILRQADRLGSLADSMGGIDSLDDSPVRRSTVTTGALLDRIGESAEAAARDAGVVVSLSCADRTASAEVDEGVVLRVADNLVSNAVRHAASSVRVDVVWSNDVLSLSVRDDGPGFGDSAGKALEPFWRGRNERSRSAGGSDGHMGLGLYVCSVLCARHGGSISVSDAPGGGGLAVATFQAPRSPEGESGESSGS